VTTREPKAQRIRTVGLLLLGIALVLLVSSPTWFAGGQTAIGVAQLVVAVGLAVVGLALVRRSGRAG
jgi:hypothetical protein